MKQRWRQLVSSQAHVLSADPGSAQLEYRAERERERQIVLEPRQPGPSTGQAHARPQIAEENHWPSSCRTIWEANLFPTRKPTV